MSKPQMRRSVTLLGRVFQSPEPDPFHTKTAGVVPNPDSSPVGTLGQNAHLCATLIILWLVLGLYGEVLVFSGAAVDCSQRLGQTLSLSRPPFDQAGNLSDVSR